MVSKTSFSKSALLAFSASILSVSPALALSSSKLNMFAQNNILFYDPTGTSNLCDSSQNCNIIGDTDDERLWSGLRHTGFTPEQSAAIMGNIYNEGNTPTRQETCYNTARNNGYTTQEGKPYDIHLDSTNGAHHGSGMQTIGGCSGYAEGEGVAGVGVGLMGWTAHNVREGYLQLMADAGLSQYFEGDAYKTYGSYNTDSQLKQAIIDATGSDSDYWLLWCIAIRFIHTELTSSAYASFTNLTSVSDMAGYIASQYEKCEGCQTGQAEYNQRINDAESVYSRYTAGEFDSVENNESSSPCASSENVTSPEEALYFVQQFILDTNELYNQSYPVVNSISINTLTNTPGQDNAVSPSSSILSGWISQGLITSNDKVDGCWGGKYCGQCTAFSGWFVGMMTNYLYNSGNGEAVVSNLLIRNSSLSATNTPTAFSIFSEPGSSTNPAGHTGVVIGDLGDGSYLTIENNAKGNNRIMVQQRTFNSSASFVYVGDQLKLSHLGTTYD